MQRPIRMVSFLLPLLVYFFLIHAFWTAGTTDYLNNGPPNVSLQRSTNAVPDSQLSPSFAQSMIQQQLSPNHRAPFSPQPNAGEFILEIFSRQQIQI